MATKRTAEQLTALDRLRALLPPGSTVWTTVKHVSRSGMSRVIDARVIQNDEPQWLSGYIARAGLFPFDPKRDALRVDGTGMDMTFLVTYRLAQALYPDGFGCIGRGDFAGHVERGPCPSNAHANGDRDYTPHGAVTGCQQRRCVCHDPSIQQRMSTEGTFCSTCGCSPKAHWHRSGGYALRNRNL